jgi:hypothetical protein
MKAAQTPDEFTPLSTSLRLRNDGNTMIIMILDTSPPPLIMRCTTLEKAMDVRRTILRERLSCHELYGMKADRTGSPERAREGSLPDRGRRWASISRSDASPQGLPTASDVLCMVLPEAPCSLFYSIL